MKQIVQKDSGSYIDSWTSLGVNKGNTLKIGTSTQSEMKGTFIELSWHYVLPPTTLTYC